MSEGGSPGKRQGFNVRYGVERGLRLGLRVGVNPGSWSTDEKGEGRRASGAVA